MKSVITHKRKRPPPTGKGELLGVRIHPPQLAALDTWIGQQPDKLSRPEAVRRLVEQALIQSSDQGGTTEQTAQKALELAARAADRLVDKSISVEQQEHRKRALIKGPKEFREIREDLPKPRKGS
jgi:hypothetical protein